MSVKNYYIFDLDDTLYQKNDGQIQNCINSQNLKKIKDKNGFIIVFSNASYNHCIFWIDKLKISKYISVIISTDIIGGLKPDLVVYLKLMMVCNISRNDNIFFFDNLKSNLVSGKKIGWNTLLIHPTINIDDLDSCEKKQIDYAFKDINLAIEYLMENCK